MELTKKKLLELAQILGAVEIKVGDRDVAKKRLNCLIYSWSVNGYCTGRIYRDQNGVFYVAKSHNDVCYVAELL